MLAAVLLVYNLLKASEEQKHVIYPFPAITFALWVAGVWALNPVQTNAVTYLVQRMASVQTFFFVSSVCFYLMGRRRHLLSERFSPSVFFLYVGCLLSSICAFFSKENSAVLPAILLATEWWFFTPDLLQRVWTGLKKSKWITRWILLIGILLASIVLVQSLDGIITGYEKRHFNLQERLLTESRIVVWYISLLLFPLPSRLSIEHDVQISTSLFSPPTTCLSFCFLVLALLLILRFRKRYPLMTYGSMWFFANLTIESSVVPLELVFEHRLYLPSIGLTLCFVIGIACVGRCCLPKVPMEEFSKLSWSIVAILVSTLALLTFQRNQAWENFITISEDAAAKAPQNPRAHANLSVAYGRAGMSHEALQHAEEALKLGRPHHEDYMVASNVIVGSLIALGETEKAFVRGEELLANFPKDYDAGALPNFCLNLAQGHLDQQQPKEAYSFAHRALEFASRIDRNYHDLRLIEGMMSKILAVVAAKNTDINGDGGIDPGALPVKAWIARDFLSVGERQQAKVLLNEVLADHPDELESPQILASIVEGEKLDAIQRQKEDFKRKYVQHPYTAFNFYMAAAYLICENRLTSPLQNLGMSFLNHAIKLEPNNPDPYLLTGWYHYEKGEYQDAAEWARKAHRLDANNAKVWLGLGFFLIKADQPTAAIDCFRKVLELYPGYPKKRVILGIISNLEEGVGSFKAAKNSFDRS
jgi:protein O-mannosyl-transferase